MHILIDSREIKPLSFKSLPKTKNSSGLKITTSVEKLEVGDYGLRLGDGTIAPIIFERKSKADLWGTLCKGYERFKREITRAKDDNIKLILITECGYKDVRDGYRFRVKGGKMRISKKSGKATTQQIHTLHIKYGLQPVFCNTRTEMASYIRDYFIAYLKNEEANK